MYAILYVIGIIVCVFLAIGFGAVGALIVYLTEGESYGEENKKEDKHTEGKN